MKKLLLSLILAIGMLSTPSFSHEHHAIQNVHKKDKIVYITRTGAKYHESSCRYLRQSKIQTTKKEAISNGYDACKVCKP
ncbi:prophage LambdaCh01, thermonuclease [Pedobacter sp. BAL39]|uniref:hypothetical protein n=1 Tax=Pedobacter sp. BAL39 TaxID=391596 RepID=UPI00015599B1|nr:hypothetical protein [Pedobacter sp. BAL39]EDM37745.1 prophage LambdaCh01, thermonuclease [Pedobacter sp. BAL39]